MCYFYFLNDVSSIISCPTSHLKVHQQGTAVSRCCIDNNSIAPSLRRRSHFRFSLKMHLKQQPCLKCDQLGSVLHVNDHFPTPEDLENCLLEVFEPRAAHRGCGTSTGQKLRVSCWQTLDT